MENVKMAQDYISQAETITDKFYTKASFSIHIIARFFLVASFIDDIFYKCTNWSVYLKFIAETCGMGYVAATVIAVINTLGVFFGVMMVLLQKNVPYACGFLLYTVVFQASTIIMALAVNLNIILKEFSLVGSIFMILSESLASNGGNSGLMSSDEGRRRSFLLLIARCLLVLMFITDLQSQRPTLPLIIQDIVASTLIVLVSLGYKTRLSAFVLAVFLTVLNFYNNDWWNSSEDMEYIMYEFFHATTVAGGLLMVAILGPGRMSVDDAKKVL